MSMLYPLKPTDITLSYISGSKKKTTLPWSVFDLEHVDVEADHERGPRDGHADHDSHEDLISHDRSHSSVST